MSDTDAIPVHIYFVLDRSGSMSSIADDVIGGFNRFIDEQKEQPGKCRLTLVQFDSQGPHEIVHDAVKIADAPHLSRATFQPRASTPLLDAEGWTINRAIEREQERAAAGKKAEAVLFVTYTDGMENASREWTKQALSAAKTAAEERGWTFTYLGCGHDAYGQSASIGTRAAAVQSFAGDSQGVGASYSSLSNATKGLRSKALRGRRVSSEALYAETGKTAEEDLASRT